MSRRNSAPTHGWVIGSRITKWMTIILMLLLVLALIIIFTVRGVIDHDCQDYYKRDIKLRHYWLHIEAGSNDLDCPQPYN